MFPSHTTKYGASALLALLTTISLMFLGRCAGDQATNQSQDPVDGGDSPQGDTNASLDGGSSKKSSEASAEGASMNNAVEGGTSGNFGAATNGGGNNAGGELTNDLSTDENAALGPTLNNATGGDGLESPNAPLNGGTSLNPTPTTSNPLNAGSAPLNDSSLALGANPPANQAAAEAPEQPAAATTPAAAATAAPTATTSGRSSSSPFTNPQMNWPGKGKVKYVTRNVTRHSSPNGPVVGEFEQGDHPLIYQNGNWVELHDGSFVRGNGLTDKGVGYNKGKKTWH